jgi:CTP synthase (UTP-ammonia lyase)
MDLEFTWLPTDALERSECESLDNLNGLLCAPGSPYRSMKGALGAIRFARVRGLPFLGTCGGFQHAVIEYAQNVLGAVDAQIEEVDPEASALFISALSCSLVGETRRILIKEGSMVSRIYGQAAVEERYNCNFGLNPRYQSLLDVSGFRVSGMDETGEARILELEGHAFYVATLFQPQLSSTPENPHKLITAYLNAFCQSRV